MTIKKEYLQHKHYANYVLMGQARQTARSSYYDIDYTRVSQSMANVEGPLCAVLLDASDDVVVDDNDIADTCSQGQPPTNNMNLTVDKAVCLPTTNAGQQSQMHFYVTGENVGKTVEISLANGLGNGDLLHRYGSRPNLSVYDAISNTSATQEKIEIRAAQQGWNYVHVQAQTSLSGATLFLRYAN